jgi:hypothetical protein
MKKIIWFIALWPLFFAVFFVSAFKLFSPSPFEGKEPKTWHIESMTGKENVVLNHYSVTIDPNGHLTLVCPEAISSARWAWDDGELFFHIHAEDPILKTLGGSWTIVENSAHRLRLQTSGGALQVNLVPHQEVGEG